MWRPTGGWTADFAARRRDSRFGRGWFGAVARQRGRSAFPGGDANDAIVRERELRCATQAEHGEAMIAGDEAHGEHAAVASLDSVEGVYKVPVPEPGTWHSRGRGTAFPGALG